MIDPLERRWIWIFGGFAALITTLPYLIGFAMQGTDWRYTGLLIASEDGSSYLAKMLLGSSGDWFFRTPYTAYPQAGFLAFLPYILLGKLAAGAGRYEQLVFLFQFFRVTGVLAAVWATYGFIAHYAVSKTLRRLGTALALFGGGLGFLSLVGVNQIWQGVMHMPLEFYSPETFGFLALLALPHLAWGRALLLWGLLLHVRGSKPQAGLLVGFYWLLLGLMQPLTIISAWAVQAAHIAGWALCLLWKRESNWGKWRSAVLRAGISGLVSSPLVLYNFLAFQFDPFLSRWQARNLIPSPPVADYLLAYAVLLPLVIVGIWAWRRNLSADRILPLAWLVIFPLLAYAPYNLQRRLPEGVWIAICVLAITGMDALPARWRRPVRVALPLAFLSSAVLWMGAILGVSRPAEPLFRPAAEVQAMLALNELAQKDAVVLAAYESSTVLPTRAPVRVWIGHGPESLDLEKFQPRIQAFFSPPSGVQERNNLLVSMNVNYVFYGPHEQALGEWNPAESEILQEVYHDGEYSLYRVVGLLK